MKSALGKLGWVVGFPLGILLVVFILGYSAVRWNFWPPDCGILPIKEAKRVCEFSKLEKAPNGKPAKVTFWVTIPHNLPADKLFLRIEGKDPVEMEKINNVSFQKLISATTGDTFKYRYLRNTDKSFSDPKELKLRAYDKKVYDFVGAWSDSSGDLGLDKNITAAIDMKDTWTINYNMNLFEDTRWNIDSSMDRAVAAGAKEFGVFSFIDMSGDKDDFTLVETASPYYHWRDAAITESEMKTLAKKAKARGLKVVLHYNIGADYNKYYNVSPIGRFSGGQAGSGVGGNDAEAQAGADFGRDDSKTKDWLDRYFTQLEGILLEWGGRAERAGIDAIDITPQYRAVPVAPLYDYGDERFIKIIKSLRGVYSGGIYGSNFFKYGGLRYEPKPEYIDHLDRLTIYVAPINVRLNASISEMRQAHSEFLNGLERAFANYSKPLFLVISEGSYDGVTSGRPGREWNDYAEALAAGYKEDWQEQADSTEAFFQAMAGRTKFAGVITKFWWDDLMGPKYAGNLTNLEDSIRNKPAEAVWKKWIFSK